MSTRENNVPDSIRPYLNEIAERLWADRAAVMVGAGFSKNAGNGFPDWNQLGDLFYQKAHGFKPDPATQTYMNVLRLAEDVQAAAGRPVLDNLLRSNIPDLDIEPSSLHVDLLEFPWVDVFTTNYDTLLERASAKVVNRRYEQVVNKEDIPYAIKPRIVKLHGSFPSERPFIITEEDYRRYPHDYAPFVNTVQQSLLENTFCLIGFSGDDPNFLQWTGWIRDNIGKDKTQKIYLIGLFELPAARLKLLAERGIIVVDLSCCEGIGKQDHKKALGVFFNFIRSKKPNALDWPSNPETIRPAHGKFDIQVIKKITEEWKKQRKSYPGWLILPHQNRQNLWRFTEAWINYLPNTEKLPPGLDIQYIFELVWRLERCLLPIFNNIAELCEKLLKKNWPFRSEKTLDNYQAYSKKEDSYAFTSSDIREACLAISLAMLRFYREEGELVKWQEMESQLKSISDHLCSEQKEFLNYEGFLFSVFTLDLPSIKLRLDNWRPNEAQPYWVAKRAVALAELGQLSNTDEQIRFSLVESRRKSNNNNSSPVYLSVSNEAFQMLLFRYVRDASHWILDKPATLEEEELIKEELFNEWIIRKQKEEPAQPANSAVKSTEKFRHFNDDWSDLYKNRFNDRKSDWDQMLRNIRSTQRKNELQQQNSRWDELKAFRCDPWNEIQLFELTLKGQSNQEKTITEQRQFDIGRTTQTRHLGYSDQAAIEGYSFLRFCEEIGLPFKIGNSIMATKSALASLQHISRHSPFWAIATLVRVGDTKAIDSLFSRESVYKYTAKEADHLVNGYLDALNKSQNDIHAGDTFRSVNFGIRLAQLLPEVISRLCCKCSDDTKHRILSFITGIYASPNQTKYKNINYLLGRLISSLSEVEQYKLIPSLLNIPFPKGNNPRQNVEYINPFLLLDISQKPECALPLVIEHKQLGLLLNQASSSNTDSRDWAIASLMKLYELELLDDSQNTELAKAIWAIKDKHNLPENADFYKFAFLRLPHPADVEPSSLFKSYISSAHFPIQNKKEGKGIRITGGSIPIVHEIIGANANNNSFWSPKEAVEILLRLIKWWDADKSQLHDNKSEPVKFSDVQKEFRDRFSRLLDLLAEVVAPNLNADLPGKIKKPLSVLLKEVREYELPSLKAQAACIHIYPELKSDVYSRINDALHSDQRCNQMDGLKAITQIIIDGNDTKAKTADSELVLMLSQYLTWCPTRYITPALWIMVRILKSSSSNISGSLETATQARLSRLLTDTAYNNDNSEMNFEEKLEVRRTCSILAAALWGYYTSESVSVPSVLEEWREACLSENEFSEIQNPWKDITCTTERDL